MKYKAILFDNDDTLMDFQTGNKNAIDLLMDELGYDHPDRYNQYEKINTQCWKALEKGELNQNQVKYERFKRFLAKYHIEGDYRQVADRFAQLLGKENTLLPGVEETLKTISKKLPIIIITNGITVIQKARFQNSLIKEFAKKIIISEEVGISKPDPDIFKIALDYIGIKPEEALMVGDGIESDVRGANDANIDVCWMNPTGKKLPEELHVEYEIKTIQDCIKIALIDKER